MHSREEAPPVKISAASRKKKLLLLFSPAFLFAIWVMTHGVLRWRETETLDGQYKYVEVNGHKMHMQILGDDRHVIVLLPGFGTPSPIIDFTPLSNALAAHATVVVVEPFGYGNSEIVDDTRTVDRIVDELRCGLKEAKLSPPYSLVAHSMSGIYAHYYAAKHPCEVDALIGIDAAVPEFFQHEEVPGTCLEERTIQACGMVRIAQYLAPSSITPDEMAHAYSKADLDRYRRLAVRNYYNASLVSECETYDANGRKALALGRNSDLPVLYFISDNGGNRSQWDRIRIDSLSSHTIGVAKTVSGGHYLHRTQATALAKDIFAFVDSCHTHRSVGCPTTTAKTGESGS